MAKQIKFPVIVEVSARHVHLKKRDLEKLFGKGYKLRKFKFLSQPGEFASKETVTIYGEKDFFEKVRVIGPVRDYTQVEISQTDAYFLGIKAPFRLSGDLKNAGKCVIKGPKGSIRVSSGVIIPLRHLHCPESFARRYNLKRKKFVSLEIKNSLRPVVFYKVYLRISPSCKLAVHLDTDEGNAAGINKTSKGIVYLN